MANDIFKKRRDRVMETMGEGVAIFPANPEQRRNGDVDYPYRPDSDLFYLSGFAEPGSFLVLRPGHETPFTMFVRPRDPAMEVWTGKRAGTDGARERYGADAAFTIDEFEGLLPDLLKDQPTLWYRMGKHRDLDELMTRTLTDLRAKGRAGVRVPAAIRDPGEIVSEMRLFKDPAEIEAMRRTTAATVEGHLAAMRAVRPGMGEHELQAIIEYVFRRNGAVDTSYGSIVAGGNNACVLHYIENAEPLKDGDLVLIDAGSEVGCYAGDITRTIPVNGKFTEAQKRVYEIVLRAQKASLEDAQPGKSFADFHNTSVRILTEGLVELGILKGAVDQLIADEAYKPWYMHRTGHWIGMDVHDVGDYFAGPGVHRELEPGMMFTVEPGLYLDQNDERVPPELRGIGIRIEDDVLITADGHENFTAACPKEIADIERVMSEDAVLPL